MARKATTAALAKERARERANRFLEREQRLLATAEEYEKVRAELDGISDATDAKIVKIREQAEAKIMEAREQAEREATDARAKAEKLQQQMLAEGVSRREVSERLGLPLREVVKSVKTKPSKAPTPPAPAADESGEVPLA